MDGKKAARACHKSEAIFDFVAVSWQILALMIVDGALGIQIRCKTFRVFFDFLCISRNYHKSMAICTMEINSNIQTFLSATVDSAACSETFLIKLLFSPSMAGNWKSGIQISLKFFSTII